MGTSEWHDPSCLMGSLGMGGHCTPGHSGSSEGEYAVGLCSRWLAPKIWVERIQGNRHLVLDQQQEFCCHLKTKWFLKQGLKQKLVLRYVFVKDVIQNIAN